MNSKAKIHIGIEIKKRFDLSGMTQREFGAKIGVMQQNVARIFNNESIDTKRLIAISNALDFNFFELFVNRDSISIHGDNNQLNECGASENINFASAPPDDHLRVQLLERLLSEKDQRIHELKERIQELKNK